MRTISQWKTKLLVTAGYGCVLLIFWYLNVPCIFLSLFHVVCPGCGMSRAMFRVLQLDFVAAFSYHPMFWSVPILYCYFLLDGRLLKKAWMDRLVLWLIAGGFLLQWLWKIVRN